MHNPDKIMAGVPDRHEVATAVNGVAAVTLPAPDSKMQWLVLATTISMNGDPTTAPAFTMVSGASTLERIDFPNAACAPYNSRGVYKGLPGTSVVLSLPALGASVRGTVSCRAMLIPAHSA